MNHANLIDQFRALIRARFDYRFKLKDELYIAFLFNPNFKHSNILDKRVPNKHQFLQDELNKLARLDNQNNSNQNNLHQVDENLNDSNNSNGPQNPSLCRLNILERNLNLTEWSD